MSEEIMPLNRGGTKKVWRKWEITELSNLVDRALATGNSTEDTADLDNLDWADIAQRLSSDKDAVECFIRYRNNDDPAINKGEWNIEEDMQLLKIARKYNEHDWEAISFSLGTGRTPWQCLKHYQQALNPAAVNHEPWTDRENALLAEAVSIYGTNSWQLIAASLENRSAAQCRSRWPHADERNQDVVKREWTIEEDRRLFLSAIALSAPSASVFKKTEAEIAALLADIRATTTGPAHAITTTTTSSRGNKRAARTCAFSEADDVWIKVSEFVPGKNSIQCFERWTNHLDPTLSSAPFSDTEDELFRGLLDRHGPGDWAELSTWFPGRTDRDMLGRWKILLASKGSEGKKELKSYFQTSRRKRLVLPSKLGRSGAHAHSQLRAADFDPVLAVTFDSSSTLASTLSSSVQTPRSGL